MVLQLAREATVFRAVRRRIAEVAPRTIDVSFEAEELGLSNSVARQAGYDRRQRDPDRLQLAEKYRSLSAHPKVRRYVLSAARRVAEAAASSQVARNQSDRSGAGLETL